jgi:hypothetical protein
VSQKYQRRIPLDIPVDSRRGITGMSRNVTANLPARIMPFRDSHHADSVNVRLTKLAQDFRHGIAAEPDPSRQLQERPVA